jgi:hypothetical protein
MRWLLRLLSLCGQSRLFSHPGFILCGFILLLFLFLMKQFSLFDVNLSGLVSILHCIAVISSIAYDEILCLYAFHHASPFLSTCPCH